MSLGQRLRLYIDVNGITVRAFSERSGIPYRSVHEYLSDKRKPSADHLENMARLGVDIAWLLTGEKRASLTFDFTGYADHIEKVSGIVAADDDLSRYFLNDAVQIVDRWMIDHPNSAPSMGLFGWIASVVSLWGLYANAAEGISDKIIASRKNGLSAEEVGEQITTMLRPFLLERLKVIQPHARSTGKGS